MALNAVKLFANLFFIGALQFYSVETSKHEGHLDLKHSDRCCSYNKTTEEVICNRCNKEFSITNIPPGAVKLVIKNSRNMKLTKKMLQNVSRSSITSISIYNCKILSLSRKTFQNLNITELDLSRNFGGFMTKDLAASFHSLGKSRIKKLSLNWMRIEKLPKDMFAGLKSTKIEEIRLSHNYLRYIDGEVFKSLKYLRKLDLGWNGISDNNNTFTGISQVTHLTLSGSWFSFFPNFCDEKNESMMPNLKELDLNYPKINSLSRPITCLNTLQKLNLSGLPLRLLYNNTFAYLPSLKVLSLRHMGSQLKNIRMYAFNSSSLENLTFSVNGDFAFNDRNKGHFHPKYLFAFTENLRYLDLSYNKFQLSDENWIQIFKPLKKLQTLKLKHASMQKLPIKIGGVLQALEKLDLSGNAITSWDGSIPFSNFMGLKKLSLRGNGILIINRTSFPEQWISGKGPLRKLHLAGNPFSCSCELSWFRKWMDQTEYLNISTDKDIWECAMSKEKVLSYHPLNTFACLVQYIVPSLIGLLVILATAFMCYVFRFRIKLWLYMRGCHSKQHGYQKISDKPFRYDSFVVYAYPDLHFVQNELIPKMEEEYNRRLCIRDRDFELGSVFSSAIAENIEASRTIILLLSSNFAKDNWCKFQLDVANHLIIQYGQLTIIPICLENIKFRFMNELIFKVLTSMDVLTWSGDNATQEFFWKAMLDNIPVCDHEDLSLNRSVQMYDAL